MKRAAVIGWPIEHSRSPLIHGYWLAIYGIDGAYTKVAVPPADVAGFLRDLSRNGFLGCNVTVPHKEIAFQTADDLDPSASAVGAANTVWVERGRLVAANTDTYGFMTHLDLSAPGWMASGRSVSVLGAGGAARAVIYGLLDRGVARVDVFNRSIERAAALVKQFGPSVVAHNWEDRSSGSRDASVIVNTTTLGMNGAGDPDIDFTILAGDAIAADIVYVPLETRFLRRARSAGLRTVDGLGMLLHQAVPGFEKWFGVRPEVTDELKRRIMADIEMQR